MLRTFSVYFTLNMDNQSRRTVVPLSDPPSLLEPSDDRLLADSCSSRLSALLRRSSLRSIRLREEVIGRGLMGIVRLSL